MLSHDFVAVDFEIANDSLASACSVGIVAVKNLKIVKTEYHLIRPVNPYFAEKNIKIHGITPDSVKDAPLFPDIWKEIQHYFQENLAVAHNAHFDMSVLKLCLMEHRLKIPRFHYLCSIPISTRVCGGQGIGTSLKERAGYFGISMEGHHNALSDARICASIVIGTIKQGQWNSFRSFCQEEPGLPIKDFTDLSPRKRFGKPYRFQRIAISEITATVESFNEAHHFYGKNVVFTGKLKNIDRRTAMQEIVNLGGKVKSSVSKKTEIIILGLQDKTLVGAEGISLKERRAYELIEQGFDIEIIREERFLKLLNL